MRAFVYQEINRAEDSPNRDKPVFIIDYNKQFNPGCSKMQSSDETYFIQKLKDIKRNNSVTLLSKLPPKMPRVDGNILREPYDLSFLNQASASHESHK